MRVFWSFSPYFLFEKARQREIGIEFSPFSYMKKGKKERKISLFFRYFFFPVSTKKVDEKM